MERNSVAKTIQALVAWITSNSLTSQSLDFLATFIPNHSVMTNIQSGVSHAQPKISAGEIAKANDELRRTFDTSDGIHQVLVTS